MKQKEDDRQNIFTAELSRRHLIKLGLFTSGLCLVPGRVAASIEDMLPDGEDALPLTDERVICIYNLHTKEYLKATYWKNGEYIREVLFVEGKNLWWVRLF